MKKRTLKDVRRISERIREVAESNKNEDVEICLFENMNFIRDMAGINPRFDYNSVLSEAVFERRDEVKITLGKLPKKLKEFVKSHAKKTKGGIVFGTDVVITSPMHAPEFDEFDYNFFVFSDLNRGTEVNPQAGIKPFSNETKTIKLKPHEAVLWGHHHHGYWTLYLHPEWQEKIHEDSIGWSYQENIFESEKHKKGDEIPFTEKRFRDLLTQGYGVAVIHTGYYADSMEFGDFITKDYIKKAKKSGKWDSKFIDMLARNAANAAKVDYLPPKTSKKRRVAKIKIQDVPED